MLLSSLLLFCDPIGKPLAGIDLDHYALSARTHHPRDLFQSHPDQPQRQRHPFRKKIERLARFDDAARSKRGEKRHPRSRFAPLPKKRSLLAIECASADWATRSSSRNSLRRAKALRNPFQNPSPAPSRRKPFRQRFPRDRDDRQMGR